MHLLHPVMIAFSIVLFMLVMVYEALGLITGKRLWPILAKIHIVFAALAVFLTALSGLIDFKTTWMTEDGYRTMNTHKTLGITIFIIILLLANYRYLFQKMLPSVMFKVYLASGAICLGLILGTAYIGCAGVFYHGTGVKQAMINYTKTEEYLKKLYKLDELPQPTASDSLLVSSSELANDTLYIQFDTLNQDTHTLHHKTDIKITD